MKIITKTPEETLAFGETLGRCLQPGDIVLLCGDLGSGKTTLTQGICRGLGMEGYIRSPTFTLINEYQGRTPIYHVDLYRLESFKEIEALGLEEVFFGNGISIVEWAEKLYKYNENKAHIGFGIESRIEIRLAIVDDETRQFDVQPMKMASRSFSLFPLQ